MRPSPSAEPVMKTLAIASSARVAALRCQPTGAHPAGAHPAGAHPAGAHPAGRSRRRGAVNQLRRRAAHAYIWGAVSDFPIPVLLAATAERRPEVAAWLSELPAIVAGLAERWSLRVDAPFQPGGFCSWTAPAACLSGGHDSERVLKVGFPFDSGEQRDEAAALRIWDGDGAVRIYAALETPTANALLLERCVPGTRLRDALPEPERDVVVAGLLRRLWARAAASSRPEEGWPFRPLSEMCDAWADQFWRDYAAADPSSRLDPGLAKDGIDLFRELPRTAADSVLLCTDLHSENILAARRAPWLAIDPKPYAGDPAYDLLQHMINCERMHSDPGGLCDRMACLAGVDPGRARQWLFARAVQQSLDWGRLSVMHEVAERMAP
jgi:streptomycin 6-kinase